MFVLTKTKPSPTIILRIPLVMLYGKGCEIFFEMRDATILYIYDLFGIRNSEFRMNGTLGSPIRMVTQRTECQSGPSTDARS